MNDQSENGRRNRSIVRRVITRILSYLPVTSRTKLKLTARLRNLGVFGEERKIHVRPYISGWTGNWLKPLLPLSYTKVWGYLGLTGMNYVSVSISGQTSETLPFLNPNSQYYHAWFGVYAVTNSSYPFGFVGEKPDPDALAELFIADQRYWQSIMMGASLFEPRFTIHSKAEQINLPSLVERCFVFYGTMATHSVLVTKGQQAAYLQRFFPIPPEREWSSVVSPGHPLEQWGFGAVWADYASGTTFCAYGSGSKFEDQQGALHDYKCAVEPELLTLLGNLRMRPIGG